MIFESTTDKPKRERVCHFCLKTQKEVKKMVEASTGACICDECISQCNEIFAQEEEKGEKS